VHAQVSGQDKPGDLFRIGQQIGTNCCFCLTVERLALGRIVLLHKERSYCQTGVFTEVVKVIGKWPKHMYYSRSGVINK